MLKSVIVLCFVTAVVCFSVGKEKDNVALPIRIKENGVVKELSISLDSNWRWLHNKDGYDNCFNGEWVKKYCPDEDTCSRNCVIDGVDSADWKAPYGVSTSGNSVRIGYVTKGPYGTNVGARVYLVDGKKYYGVDLRNKEFVFTVDVSRVECGMNGALYTVEMPLNNPYDSDLDATYGINYGDAQCPKDIKYVHGNANFGKRGICSNEYDLWEANRFATAVAWHPCSKSGVYACTSDKECGVDKYRFEGVCDKNGASYNPNRVGKTDFYGPGKKVDTRKPITVKTKFFAANGEITKIVRTYVQDGREIFGHEDTSASMKALKEMMEEPDHFHELGGMKTMYDSMKRKQVLVLSLWDDVSVNMRWLDSIYPPGSNDPASYRGPCSNHDNSPDFLRKNYADAYVVYSDIQINDLSDTDDNDNNNDNNENLCQEVWGHCGSYSDIPVCCDELKCVKFDKWYSQCQPQDYVPSTPPTASPPSLPEEQPSPHCNEERVCSCSKCVCEVAD